MVRLFLGEGRFDDAQTYIERAKSHAVNHTYRLGFAMEAQAELWYKQHRLEETRSEALHAVDVYEKLGAVEDLGRCRRVLRRIEQGMEKPVIPDRSSDDERVAKSK